MDKQQKENIGLRPIIADYLRRWKLILGTGIFSLILAVLYLVVYPVTYEVMARIQIQEEHDMMSTGSFGLGEAAGMMRSFGLGSMASKVGISIDDEIQTMYSSSMMSEMITQLGLYVEYTKPYIFWYKMYGEEPVKVDCDLTTLNGMEESVKFKINVSGGGKIQIKSKTKKETRKFSFDSFPVVIDLKQGRFVITKNPESSETSFRIVAEVFPPSWVAETLAKELNIEDYSNASNFIEFTYRDHARQRAKNIINTLISLYNKEAYSYKKKIGDSSLDFLYGRLESVMSDLNEVEQQIELFKVANKLTDVQFDIQYYAEYLKDLNIKIIELDQQTYLIELMDAFVKNPANKYALVPSLFTSSPDTESSTVSVYNELLLKRDQAIKNSSSETNPTVVDLTAQIDKMRESLYQMIDNYHQTMMLSRKNLESKEKELLSKMQCPNRKKSTAIMCVSRKYFKAYT